MFFKVISSAKKITNHQVLEDLKSDQIIAHFSKINGQGSNNTIFKVTLFSVDLSSKQIRLSLTKNSRKIQITQSTTNNGNVNYYARPVVKNLTPTEKTILCDMIFEIVVKHRELSKNLNNGLGRIPTVSHFIDENAF